MRLSGLGSVRSMNRLLVLCLCLVLIGLVTAGAVVYTNHSGTDDMLPGVQACQAEPLQQNQAAYVHSAVGGSGPVIQAFEADPMELDTPGSTTVYTFKVKRATKVQLIEANNILKNINNPSGATLKGTANGLPASAIEADDSGNFTAVLIASNEGGSVQEELTLSLAADILPESPPPSPTDNQTDQYEPQWLEQYSTPHASTSGGPSTPRNEPNFFECPESCPYCLKSAEASSQGFTNRCSAEPCYYSPDKNEEWYCYSEPEGWCCAEGTVMQSTKSACTRIGGFWSTSHIEAIERCQPIGYCCLRGQVYYPATETDCARMGGSYWSTSQYEVVEHCQPRTCWCCLNGQVYQTTLAQCSQSGGTCYTSQTEAEANCRSQGDTGYPYSWR